MRRFALLTVLFVTGCATELSWKTIPGSVDNGSPRSIRYRAADEIWIIGTNPMLIRDHGKWSTVNLCFEEKSQLPEIAFDTDGVVWAHCTLSTATTKHTLLRYDAQKVAREVPMPAGETAVILAQTGPTMRLLGAKSFYRWEGDHWTTVAAYSADDRYRITNGIGTSPDDFFLDATASDGRATSLYWEKDHFSQTTSDAALPNLTLRDGELFSGAARFVGGKLVPLAESADTMGRGVRVTSALNEKTIGYLTMPASTAFESAAGGGVWLAEDADSDLEFLGNAPFSSGNLYRGGGIGFFAVLDTDHVLVGVAPGAAGGPLNGAKLVEGSR